MPCRPGAGRTSRAWHSPLSATPRPPTGDRSWWPPRRSGPVRSTWSPLPASPTPIVCPCCCWPATRSPAACPTRCCSRSNTSGIRRSRSTMRSSRSAGTGIASCARSRSSTRCRTRSSVMLSPADCGPAFIALPQDVQAEAFDFPDEFFATTVHHIPRQRADLDQLQRAAAALKSAAAAADHRRRGSALLRGRGRVGRLRRGSQRPRGRDGRRASQPAGARIRTTPVRSA